MHGAVCFARMEMALGRMRRAEEEPLPRVENRSRGKVMRGEASYPGDEVPN